MRLTEWRKSQGMSLRKAAAYLKVSASLYSKWERGLSKPGAENLARIEEGTKGAVTAKDLLGPGRKSYFIRVEE